MYYKYSIGAVHILHFTICTTRSTVEGGWGKWYPWSSCSVSCGGGIRERTRFCNYPPPPKNGKDCAGSGESSESCNEHPCPALLSKLIKYLF